MPDVPPQSETTPVGEQTLVAGVKPLSQRDRLQAAMQGPLRAPCAQKPCDVGLFDADARSQLDMFIHATKGNPS